MIHIDRKKAEAHMSGLKQLRAWLSGFSAARNGPASVLGHGIPGEMALRFMIVEIDQALLEQPIPAAKRARKAAKRKGGE